MIESQREEHAYPVEQTLHEAEGDSPPSGKSQMRICSFRSRMNGWPRLTEYERAKNPNCVTIEEVMRNSTGVHIKREKE
eukprot:6268368-Prorocentrum_lima.AAC.1